MKLSKTSLPHLIIVAMVILFSALAHAENAENWEEGNVPLVGRVSHLEGDLVRHDAEQNDWVTTIKDSPVGAGDRLYSHEDARVEMIIPNNTWIRMDGDTEIELTALDENFTDLTFTLGTVRLYNKSSTAEMRTTTPFGEIITPAGSHTDIYLYSDGIDIISLRNRAFFIHDRSGRRYEIKDTSAALSADTYQVSASQPDVASRWGRWNKKMDALWAKRMRTNGDSITYLPPALHHDAYALDTHGRWDRVYYQGAYYRFWRPVHVRVGWTPFSSGVWRVRWQDNVWIPHEPFGYVTHHYGNWIRTSGHWYWAPPVTRVMIHAGLPLFRIGFAWYPGRVAWLQAGFHVGWFPLAPFEPFYSHRHWGRRTYVVSKRGHYRHRRHIYKHRRHAVVIHKDRMYRSRNYRDARIRNASRSAVGTNLRTARVLDRSAFKDQRRRTAIKHYKQTPAERKRHTRRFREDQRQREVRKDAKYTRSTSRDPNPRSSRIKQRAQQAPSRQTERMKKRVRRAAPPDSRAPEAIKAQRSRKSRPADTVIKRQNSNSGTRTPAETRVIKPRKNRRQNSVTPFPGERPKKETIRKRVKPQSEPRRLQTDRRQVRSGERRALQSDQANTTRNRPAQYQSRERSNAPRGYAPQDRQGNRSPEITTGGRPRSRSVR